MCLRWRLFGCCKNVLKDLGGPRQGLVGRWSVDPMDADNAMSPTTPATWIATWRRATYVDDGSLALGGQNTPTAGAPTLRGDPKEKPSPLRWIGTNGMKRPCVHGVEITCNAIIMANCVADVGPFFTINRPWSLPELKTHYGVAHGTSSAVFEKRLTRSEST